MSFTKRIAELEVEIEHLRAEQRKALGLGATGQFPHGKSARADDQGELRAAIMPIDGRIYVDLGKPVAWLALMPNEARVLARTLERVAEQAEAQAALSRPPT